MQLVARERASTEAPPPAVRYLTAGVVAHNEEATIGKAIRSILAQELPPEYRLDVVWVVASGCTDGTIGEVELQAATDPRVRLIVETERRGKASALREFFGRARGELLLLLNSDAVAEPGAVRELLQAAEKLEPPFAIMGRPEPETRNPGLVTSMLQLQWALHHELHWEMMERGWGNNLSDELLLLSREGAPEIPAGIINDGGFFGVWLAQHRGKVAYAPKARVRIEIPTTLPEHLAQRRRIRFGTQQIHRLLATEPTTFPKFALRHPSTAVTSLRNAARSVPRGYPLLALLWFTEVCSLLLSLRDRLPRRPDHVRWERIRRTAPSWNALPRMARHSIHGESGTHHRSRAVLRIAAQFRTGVPLDEFVSLMPEEGPRTALEAREWLEKRPELGRVHADRVYPPNALPPSDPSGEARAQRFLEEAHALVRGPIGIPRSLLRCVAVTGSAAYGSVRPEDDLDFLLVARSGALWVALTLIWARLRLWRPSRRGRPEVCLNFALDERVAHREFAAPHDLLFAREALTARVLLGQAYYASLLRDAPWMGERLPRLYAARRSVQTPADDSGPAPLPVRILNALLFPLLTGYIQATTLYRNARLRTRGAGASEFRARTGFGRFTVQSIRFLELAQSYHEEEFPTVTEPGSEPIAQMSPARESHPIPVAGRARASGAEGMFVSGGISTLVETPLEHEA